MLKYNYLTLFLIILEPIQVYSVSHLLHYFEKNSKKIGEIEKKALWSQERVSESDVGFRTVTVGPASSESGDLLHPRNIFARSRRTLARMRSQSSRRAGSYWASFEVKITFEKKNLIFESEWSSLMETESAAMRAEFLKNAINRFESLEFTVLSSVPGIYSISDFIRSNQNFFRGKAGLTPFFKNIQIARSSSSNKVSSCRISAARSGEPTGFPQILEFADQNCARFIGSFFLFLCVLSSTSTRRAIFSAVLLRFCTSWIATSLLKPQQGHKMRLKRF